jgi:death-on-curing protein
VSVAKAHAFVDGKKRIAFAIMVAFLRTHGRSLDVSETRTMVDVAAGAIGEQELERWLIELRSGGG